MAENNSFLKGIKDGLPICIGYFAVSFAFGISAVGMGLSWVEALLISLTNLTSAGQLAGAPIIATGGSLIEMAVSQLVINSRYALMSVSLSQKLGQSVKPIHRFLIAFGNTDENFAMAMANKDSVGKNYMFGLILTPILGWTGGTFFGAIADSVLPAAVISALGLAIYGMFVAIVMPVMKKQKPVCLCVILAIALSCAFKFLPFLSAVPDGFVIIICAVMASAVFAIFSPVPVAEEGEK
ncbi:MAG: AzlC family ABC transporter permease [Clostridia bacterium]|nr:AzlC family ABC transporter permease [Clostridia bacterium]